MASRSSSDNKIRKNLIWRYSSSAVPGTVAAAAAAVAEQIDSRKDVTSRCRLGVDESGTLVLDLHRVPWPTVMSLCSKTTPPPGDTARRGLNGKMNGKKQTEMLY